MIEIIGIILAAIVLVVSPGILAIVRKPNIWLWFLCLANFLLGCYLVYFTCWPDRKQGPLGWPCFQHYRTPISEWAYTMFIATGPIVTAFIIFRLKRRSRLQHFQPDWVWLPILVTVYFPYIFHFGIRFL
jgi:hypothetical protein